jgi:hypothetical protein
MLNDRGVRNSDTPIAGRRKYLKNMLNDSGVTTMGSDRENPGAPNLNGPNGGPQA